MREIKFRAWDSKEKYMMTVDSIQFPAGGVLVCGPGAGSGWSSVVGDHSEETIILEQFTGLKDYNGRDVYEGDILRYDIQDHNGTDHFYENIVTFEGSEFGCKGDDPERWYWHPLSYIFENDIEPQVVGNIHDKQRTI